MTGLRLRFKTAGDSDHRRSKPRFAPVFSSYRFSKIFHIVIRVM
jgi:hypothetical protein